LVALHILPTKTRPYLTTPPKPNVTNLMRNNS
jgi:hypothetical protein